ncbi:hypothetical protein ABS71_07815 [bacterium SCN 62-11]|nr:hypothetical protein [Candidatus Eremiobacteraeota bacterium]ODT72253.1 MAG: hypothetical protein ABS71_07815 [bacterium SCN 62-11]
MDPLISGQLSEGTLESSGVFTISTQKALEKIGQFALPQDAWFLRLVQTAVMLGCKSISLRETNPLWLIVMEQPRDSVDLLPAEALMNFPLKPETCLLQAMLNLSGQQKCPEVRFTVWKDGKARHDFELLGRPTPDEPAAHQEAIVICARRPDMSRSVSLDGLRDQLTFCPIPVLAKQSFGLEIPGGFSDLRGNSWVLPFSLHEPTFLADFFACGQPQTMMLRPPEVGNSRENGGLLGPLSPFVCNLPMTAWSRSTVPAPAKIHYRGWERVPAGPWAKVGAIDTLCGDLQFTLTEGPKVNALYPVVHGVTLAPISGPWKQAGLLAAISATEVPTDLTGFKLVEGSEFQEWLRRSAQRMMIMLEEAEGFADDIVRVPLPFTPNILTFSGTIAGIVMLGFQTKMAVATLGGSVAVQYLLRQLALKKGRSAPGNPAMAQAVRDLLAQRRQLLAGL